MADDPVTLFTFDAEKRDFLRTSTTVKDANGVRAVGTWLGQKSPAYEAVMAGKAYNGAAEDSRHAVFHRLFPDRRQIVECHQHSFRGHQAIHRL